MGALKQMGQVPFAPPNVTRLAGRADVDQHQHAVRAVQYGDVPGREWRGELADNGQAIWFGQQAQCRDGCGCDGVRSDANDRAERCELVVDMGRRLIQRPVADEKRKVLVDALGSEPEKSDNVRKMVQLIVSMPEYQLC